MLGIGPAPAEISAEGFTNFLFSRIEVPVQQGFGRDDKSRSTVAALHAMVFDVFLHKRMIGSRNTFDGLDLLPVAFDGQRHAGKDRPAVHYDRTGSAGSAVAHQLCSGKSEYVVDEVIESPVRFNLEFIFLAVDSDMDSPLGLWQRFRLVAGEDVGFDRFKRVKRA